MSSFNVPMLGGQNPDIKKVYNYIQLLNDQLRYSLSNITPEDNFDQQSFLKYQETETHIAQLEVTMKGFLSEFQDLQNNVSSSIKVLDGKIALKVSKDKLCSEISATTEAITFKTGYLIIDANNFKLNKDGTATFSGTINGGSININNRFVVTSAGQVTIDSITFAQGIVTNGLLYTNYIRISGNADVEGTLTAKTMNVTGDVSCETLFERSDRRLKDNIQDIPDQTALELVLGMRPVTFQFVDTGQRSMGLIAQEVDDLQERLGTDLPLVDHSGEYLAIPYGNNSVLFSGAIRQQGREIEALEKAVKRMKEERNEGCI